MTDTERQAEAATIAKRHLDALATVPQLTDMPTSVYAAERLAKQVRSLARHADIGMLGPNGIAPAVADCVSRAAFVGFGWRAAA